MFCSSLGLRVKSTLLLSTAGLGNGFGVSPVIFVYPAVFFCGRDAAKPSVLMQSSIHISVFTFVTFTSAADVTFNYA